MIVEKGCFERGCACYDDRVDEGVGVDVFQKPANDEQILVMWRLSNLPSSQKPGCAPRPP